MRVFIITEVELPRLVMVALLKMQTIIQGAGYRIDWRGLSRGWNIRVWKGNTFVGEFMYYPKRNTFEAEEKQPDGNTKELFSLLTELFGEAVGEPQSA